MAVVGDLTDISMQESDTFSLAKNVAVGWYLKLIYIVVSIRNEVLFCFIFSTFLRNRGLNGIVSIGYAPTTFKGKNRFVENEGASLRVSYSNIDVDQR